MTVSRKELAAPALTVAPLLLGATVVSDIGDERVTLRITEVEAYEGKQDPASHAFRGRTKRTEVMFGPPGHLYCYFVYGMHWCANITCQPAGSAAAVLLRAAEIVQGERVARARTPTSLGTAKLASGPARLARCLGLHGVHSGLDLLSRSSPVRLTRLAGVPDFRTGPRVGVAAAAGHPWRFWLPDEPSVSPYRAGGRRVLRQTGQP
ncbi:MAG TPA: DNA-3-methyladenine glycosylase [Jatrophihabitans sp.]|nr:DNA-3-methyladenine glycosylase [Jatrophihabitans sp.]